MNILTATQTRFPPISSLRRVSARKKIHTIQFCSGGASEPESKDPSEGDKRRQEILARIAMLQAQKVHITDFLDERSAFLTQIAEEANTEFNQIGDKALQDLDDASARIQEKLDSGMQAFEESALANRQEIEKRDKKLEEFEDQMERERNEGLFFKNLTDRKKGKDQRKATEESRKVIEVTKRNAGSKIRKNIYLALMSLLGIVIANTVAPFPDVDWRRVSAFTLIFLALLTQYVYELNFSSEATMQEDDKE